MIYGYTDNRALAAAHAFCQKCRTWTLYGHFLHDCKAVHDKFCTHDGPCK